MVKMDVLSAIATEGNIFSAHTSDEVSKIYEKNFEEQIGTPNSKILNIKDVSLKNNKNKDHFTIFQQTMKPLLFWGQCWGLNPVMGITTENPKNVRFQLVSIRFWYSLFIWLAQATVSSLCLFKLFARSVNIDGMAFFCFHFSTCLVTLLSLGTASKWPTLAKAVASSNLYVNPRIKFRCSMVLVLFFGIACVEHMLAVIANVTYVLDCIDYEGDAYGTYIRTTFVFLFDVGLPYHVTVGIFLQFLTVVSTINWNYSDIFIICISTYLTSVLEELNKKIFWASKNRLLSSSWRQLREAYTRAIRLVRIFDDAINKVIFVSFATSLFFVCLQLFNVLSNGLKGKTDEGCPNFPSGPFQGYEHSIYFFVSLMMVLLRSLSVAIVAAEVNTASKAALHALYSIPTQDYCEEVQRFIEQIHGDTVALSGFKFFNMTRELILTVAGSIVTYELVLLQFKVEAKNDIPFLKSVNETVMV